MFWIIATIVLAALALPFFKLGKRTVDGVEVNFRPWGVGILALWALLTIALSINTVPAGHIGLVKTFGEYTGEQSPGLNFKAPYQAVEKVDGRVLKKTVSLNGGEGGSAVSIETQPVYATIVVNYQLELDQARKLYNDVGADYYNRIIEPRVQQAFKAATVEYKTIDIAPKREQIRNEVAAEIDKQLDAYGIDVKDLLIKNLDFSPEFVGAIEEKQVATEKAKAAQERVAIAKADADSAREEARGVADALRIKGAAAGANKDAVALTWIEKMNPNVQVIYLDPKGSLVQIPPVKPAG